MAAFAGAALDRTTAALSAIAASIPLTGCVIRMGTVPPRSSPGPTRIDVTCQRLTVMAATSGAGGFMGKREWPG
ncbi:hypothetical protein GCM10009830_35340 [Glycomyces endophyticus]|uniref:Uncharacterized protein n=1 Tax=Glycomyces endophyticus TaxID=480996 RepID=A0ABN2HB54_9ACTN